MICLALSGKMDDGNGGFFLGNGSFFFEEEESSRFGSVNPRLLMLSMEDNTLPTYC